MINAGTNPIRLAVTGSGGMLGRDVLREGKLRGTEVIGWTRADCDVTSEKSCRKAVLENRPEVIVNCAAYTDVNRAESETDLAMLVNGEGVRNLARVCKEAGIHLITVSTDYVFDGTGTDAWSVTDITNPVNAYGRSKLAGEHAVAEILPADQFLIARTSWLYGVNGKNFVSTMMELGKAQRELRVIDDQRGTPTYTVDLARALLELADRRVAGVVHVTNSGTCSWYQFACEIFSQSGIQPKSLEPCASSDFPSPARRPANSVLSPESLLAAGVSELPHWKDALHRYLLESCSVDI